MKMEQEQSQKPKRKRFSIVPGELKVLDDPMGFTPNKCSQNARKINSIVASTHVDIWIDKHYHDRFQHGDSDGERIGIDPNTVETLVRESINHLLVYGSISRNFKFNHHKDSADKPVRIVLQKRNNGDMLNVVIEVHFLEINKFEITIKTAMVVESFKIESGQYALEIDETGSTLRKNESNKLIVIYTL